jgi:uncharacterized protein YebE (UPF0316 family)
MDELSSPILGALIIFVVRVLSIAIGTVRFLIMGRASPVLVLALAFIEALAFALTFGQVAANLGNLWNLGAYCLGFAFGTVTGMWIEERLAAGYSTLNIVSIGKSLQIAKAIRAAGFGATRSSGEGGTGTVGLIRVVSRRRNITQIVQLVMGADPKAFVTVEETRAVSHGFLERVSGRS